MSSTGEFAPEGQDFDELDAQPEYPSAFGVTFTPTVAGAVLAGLGLLAAGYLFFTQVSAKQERKQTLQQERDSLQSQVDNQPSLAGQLAEVEGELRLATVRQRQILGLLSSEETLETLLVDLERAAAAVNSGNANIDTQLRLLEFSPQSTEAQVVTDGAFGAAVNNRIKRWRFEIRSEGDFAQILDFVARIERLQPLLIVRDLSLTPAGDPALVRYDAQTQQFSPVDVPRLAGNFTLEAILPVAPSELPAEDPEAAPAN